MEHELNAFIQNFELERKEAIRNKAIELGLTNKTNPDIGILLQFIYDYKKLTVAKDQFTKKTRTPVAIDSVDLCFGRCASLERCTRRRKDGMQFCATHLKSCPHGTIDVSMMPKITVKVEIWIEHICGIPYHIDMQNNIYLHEDVIKNVNNPRKIGVWKHDEQNPDTKVATFYDVGVDEPPIVAKIAVAVDESENIVD